MYQHAYSGAYCAPNAGTITISNTLANTCSQCSSDFAW